MKRIAGMLLVAGTLAAGGATITQAKSPLPADGLAAASIFAVESHGQNNRPPAPEVGSFRAAYRESSGFPRKRPVLSLEVSIWVFRIEYRERRGPQLPWGPWHEYVTIKGDYATAKARANNVADFIEKRSKNLQTRIIETRIR